VKVHLIVGARPNFMKIAPLYKEMMKFPHDFNVKLIHTGQHYDEKMSKLFFHDLHLPVPHEYLGVGSGSHGSQTARIMEKYEEVLLKDKPDLIIVAGDVNSTVACALDATKLHIKVAHLEAGLRSYDRRMPEEINRIVTDSISDILLTPSRNADENLLKEGIPETKIHFVGNIMIDSVIGYKDEAEKSVILEELGVRSGEYALITLHRPSNVDEKESLIKIIDAFIEISKDVKLIFPMHPRTQKNLVNFGLDVKVKQADNLIITEPIGYYDFLKLQIHSMFVLTDSGGIQEETTYFNIPCLTLRENTERPITITEGSNKLIKLETSEIIREAGEILKGKAKSGKVPELWDGKTAERIIKLVKSM